MTARERRRRGRPWSHLEDDDRKLAVTDDINPLFDEYTTTDIPRSASVNSKATWVKLPDMTAEAEREVENAFQPLRERVVKRARENALDQKFPRTEPPHVVAALNHVLNGCNKPKRHGRISWLSGVVSGASLSHILASADKGTIFLIVFGVFTISLIAGWSTSR